MSVTLRTFLLTAGGALAATAGLIAPSGADAQTDGIRPLADAADVSLGAATTVEMLDDDAFTALLTDNVNMVSTVAEVDFGVIQPQQGTYDFSRADAIVDFAAENGMTARGHGLISRFGLPEWLVNGQWTAETLTAVLVDHVTTVVGRYAERNPGVVTQWDVVADAFLPDGSPRDSIWRQVIGDDYLPIAFDAARAADPDAVLFYDDFYDDFSVTQDAVDSAVPIVPGATTANSACDGVAKCVGVRAAVSGLVAAGVPIDGIGVQAHLLSPDPLDLTTFSAWIVDLGLEWAVTEFDVPLPITEIANPDSLAFQAAAYETALTACIDSSSCDTFITWGLTDRLPPEPPVGAFGGGLWFDQDDVRKPAGDAVVGVLGEFVPTPTTEPATTLPFEPTVAASVPEVTTSGDGSSSNVAIGLAVAVTALAAIGIMIVVVRRRRSNSHDPA